MGAPATTPLGFFPSLTPRYGTEVNEDNPWYESQAEMAIRGWCEAAYEEAKADQDESPELRLVDKYIEYLCGTQWPQSRPSYRSKPINNKMVRLFWELVSQLTDIRPISEISSTSRETADVEREGVLNKRVKTWWLNNDVDQKVAMAIVYAILTTCFAKLEWDPRAKPMGGGELCLRPYGPSAVLPLKPTTDLQSSEAVILEDWKGVGWLKNKYPLRASLITPDIGMSSYSVDNGVPGNVTPQLFSLLSPSMRQLMAKDKRRIGASAYPVAKYREFWLRDYTMNTSQKIVVVGDPGPYGVQYQVKPGEMFYPRGRLIVMAGRAIIHDGPNPYWHGLFPFSLLRMNVVPWQIYGMSDLKSWMDLQDILNAIFAGVIDMIKKAVNPGFFAPKTAFSETVWNQIDTSMPGWRAAYNAVSPQEPKFVNAGQLPGYVLPAMQMVSRDMEQQSGIGAVAQALQKKQMPGGETLDTMRQMQNSPIRLKARNTEIFLRDLGMQMVPNIAQFYNTKERLRMNPAPGGTAEYYEWNPDEIFKGQPMTEIRKYEFSIVEGTLLNTQRMEIALNYMRAQQTGVLSRLTVLKKLVKLGLVDVDPEQEEQQIMKEAQMGLGPKPAKKDKKGKTPAIQ